MERIISEEERIRRAEEISARRKNRIPVSNINKTKKYKISMLSKVFIQVITSMCIFGIIYFMNMNNSFAIEKIKPIISEDTDFAGIYNQIDELVKNIGNTINTDENSKESQNNINNENRTDNQSTTNNENIIDQNYVNTGNVDDTISENNKQAENIIESQDNTVNLEEIKGQDGDELKENNNMQNEDNNNENNKELSDVDFIKANANLVKPISGTITSKYGERDPTSIISANHEGVDIGANFGEDIKAAMSGTVELTSSEGGYGNHLIIANGEISTLYAHCSKIVVNQGEYIEQGQKIAEIGSTGNSTGPHLHFEIRRNNKPVDPQQIVEL